MASLTGRRMREHRAKPTKPSAMPLPPALIRLAVIVADIARKEATKCAHDGPKSPGDDR
jgi:hypothetical protein